MKLVVQIPCLNEAATIAATIAALPRSLHGVDDIAVVVVDDGSGDGTADIAATCGASVVRLPATFGLAFAFMRGIEAALAQGADVIVNTDGDNQYRGEDVARLVAPILSGEADVVIGTRRIADIDAFSGTKKALQRAGSWLVRRLSGADVADATSGFRGYSREAALQLAVFSRYTYTLETIVQAAQRGLRIVSVPIRVNAPARPSRLAPSSSHYVWHAGIGFARMFVVYRPFRFFMAPAILALAAGIALVARFLWFFIASGGAAGHLQSLVVAVMLFGVGGGLAVVALVGDLLAINRRLLEELRLESRRGRFDVAADAATQRRLG